MMNFTCDIQMKNIFLKRKVSFDNIHLFDLLKLNDEVIDHRFSIRKNILYIVEDQYHQAILY